MKNTHFTGHRTMLAQAVCLVLFGSWLSGARADTPLSLTFSETLNYDSNIRKVDINKQRDFYSETGAKIVFDKDYGRQNYKASILASVSKYKNSKDLDNNGHNINLGFSSTLGQDSYASLSYDSVRQLRSFKEQGLVRAKEITESSAVAAFFQYGSSKKISPNLSFRHSKIEYSLNSFENRTSNYGRLSLRNSPSDLLYFEAGVAKTNTEIPAYPMGGGVFGDPSRRTDFDVTTQWIVTGYSRLNATLAFSRENHPNDSARDFNGLTGNASWTFTPAGKVSYSLSASRDTSNQGGINLGSGNILTQNRVTTGITGGAKWQATYKIAVNASASFYNFGLQRSLAGFNVNSDSSSQEFGLGVSYAPTRYSSLSCNMSRYKRTQSALDLGFDGDSVSCTAAIMIDP